MSNIDIKDAIRVLSQYENLDETQSGEIIEQIMNGKATDAQIGAYLAALHMKKPTQSELVGGARVMRARVTKVQTNSSTHNLLDTCGTGADFSGTFNISTATAFVAAGAGARVAKHGNRAATSQCGSADVLAELGLNLELTPSQIGYCIDNLGIGFLFAARLHPAMKRVANPRREIGIRTIFNFLGPLSNPAQAQRQLVGTPDPKLVRIMADVLKTLGAIEAIIVCGDNMLDELTTTGPNLISHLRDGAVRDYTLVPSKYGFEAAEMHELLGGDARTNALILRGILEDKIHGPKRDIVILNAGVALVAAGLVQTLEDGFLTAERTIKGGKALGKLEALILMSNSFDC